MVSCDKVCLSYGHCICSLKSFVKVLNDGMGAVLVISSTKGSVYLSDYPVTLSGCSYMYVCGHELLWPSHGLRRNMPNVNVCVRVLIVTCVCVRVCTCDLEFFHNLFVQSRSRGAARRPPSRRALRASGSGSDSSVGQSNKGSPPSPKKKSAATIPIAKSADPFADLLSQSESLPPPRQPGVY